MPRKYRHKTDRRNGHHKPSSVSSRFEPGFMTKLDGRTEVARMLRANYESIVADLGGEADLSYFQRSLVERALWMEALIIETEHQLRIARESSDKDSAAIVTSLIGRHTQMVNAYSGLVTKLGLTKRSSTKPWAISAEVSNGDMEDGK